MKCATLSLLSVTLTTLASCAATNPSTTEFAVAGAGKPKLSREAPAPTAEKMSAKESSAPGTTVERSLTAPTLFRSDRREIFRLEAFRKDIELEELELDPEVGSDFDVFDTDRERGGLRAAFGSPRARGYVQIFGEEFGNGFGLPANQFPGEFDLFGIGGGVAGIATVHEFEDQIRLIVPYRAGLNAAWGEEEVGVVDQNLAYVEFEGEVGFGGYFYGVQPSLGIYVSSLAGTLQVEDHVTDPETDFGGTNSGCFVQLEYKHDDFPLFAKVRAMGGDVRGVALSIGASF